MAADIATIAARLALTGSAAPSKFPHNVHADTENPNGTVYAMDVTQTIMLFDDKLNVPEAGKREGMSSMIVRVNSHR